MKIERLFAVIFGGAGITLLAVAGFWANLENQFLKSSARANGVVSRLERRESNRNGRTSYNYYPVVQFRTSQGRQVTFTSSSGSYPASYQEGDTVEVAYDPARPDHAEINAFWSVWLGPVIVVGLGIVFSGIGGGLGLYIFGAAKRVAWLKQRGERIRADIIEVGLNSSITVNGRHPYRITAQWQNPGSGKIHVFNSENIWFNPQQYLAGKGVEVLIDPEKPRRYWVDVSFLPQVAE